MKNLCLFGTCYLRAEGKEEAIWQQIAVSVKAVVWT